MSAAQFGTAEAKRGSDDVRIKVEKKKRWHDLFTESCQFLFLRGLAEIWQIRFFSVLLFLSIQDVNIISV